MLAGSIRYTLRVEPKIHHKTDKEMIATVGPVVLWFSSGAATVEDFDRVRSIIDGPLGKERKVALVMLLEEGTRIPEMGVRKEAAKLIDDIDRFVGMFVVLLGSGFWASALRSAITGLSMLVRRRQAVRAYASVDEALTDLTHDMSELDGAALRGAIERFRGEMPVRRAAATP